MRKAMKRITRVALFVLVLSVLMTTALADTKHYGCNWNILSADQCSRVHTWTAKTTSSKYYITTRANTVNVGAEDTYYKVALSSGGSASARVKCNAGRLQERAISGIYTINQRYGTYAWREDSTLNTEVVDGLTYIYNR